MLLQRCCGNFDGLLSNITSKLAFLGCAPGAVPLDPRNNSLTLDKLDVSGFGCVVARETYRQLRSIKVITELGKNP